MRSIVYRQRVFKWALGVLWLCASGLAGGALADAQTSPSTTSYLGFDRNQYPGDGNLAALHKVFSYAGYWLNRPPGESSNSWIGKREKLESAGFGFLVLFNGKTYAEIRANGPAAKLGTKDGEQAAAKAKAEGFPAQTIIFLDQEEGGRMLPEQKEYIYAWVDTVTAAGFRAGVYCSGIASNEGSGKTVITAGDIRANAGARKIAYWVTNDACPPSPGCAVPARPLAPSQSGIAFADVWQYAQSPRRKEFTRGCPANYSSDGECYAPGIDRAERLHLDLDTATSRDPSQGRTRGK